MYNTFYTLLVLFLFTYSSREHAAVQIDQGSYQDRQHYIITTPYATYYYDQAGGGFSRLLDPSGKDWINFKRDPWDRYPASAASAYRGIPNLVFGSTESGAGHPGHDLCHSDVVNDHTIRTKSRSGNWAWQWEFFPDHAKLTILEKPPDQTYWFLYEGTPGGYFNPFEQYFGHDQGGPFFENPDYFRGNRIVQQWQWFYCGAKSSRYALFLAQLNNDDLPDTFSYLGNSDAGINSKDGMVVFGFGRSIDTKPLISSPQEFIIGLYKHRINGRKQHKKIKDHIQNLVN